MWATRRSMPESCWRTMSSSRRPSAVRTSTRSAKAASRSASMACVRASTSPALSSGSICSSTPLMPSSASGCGGATAMLALRASSASSTWLSAASLSLIWLPPSVRLALRLTATLPRARCWDMAARMRGSRRSKPGGSRRRMSSPRLLTERSSQCQAADPVRPSRLANPVMLLSVIRTVCRCLATRGGRLEGSLPETLAAAPGHNKNAAPAGGAGRWPALRCQRSGRLVAGGLRPRLAIGLAVRPGARQGSRLRPPLGVGILRRRLRRRLALEILFHQAPLLHVGVVILEGFGEGVAAAAVGHKVELAGFARPQHGLDRLPPRVADRRRRQPVDLIGVVRRLLADLGFLDRASPHHLAAEQAVEDGGIGLQAHVLAQAV